MKRVNNKNRTEIRFFREEKDLTQQELAKLAGVSDKTIQRYENQMMRI
ncbi:MAG: helix-turn-helix domain-containing protein [Campylobacter sp.]